MMGEDKSKYFDEFKFYLNKLDSIRGTNFYLFEKYSNHTMLVLIIGIID